MHKTQFPPCFNYKLVSSPSSLSFLNIIYYLKFLIFSSLVNFSRFKLFAKNSILIHAKRGTPFILEKFLLTYLLPTCHREVGRGEGSSRKLHFGRDRRYLLITAWLEAQRPVARLIHRRADILCILFFRAFHHLLDLSYPSFLPHFHASTSAPFFSPLDSTESSRRGRNLSPRNLSQSGDLQRIPFLNGRQLLRAITTVDKRANSWQIRDNSQGTLIYWDYVYGNRALSAI